MSALKNSLVVAVGTTLVALISSTLAAYAFSDTTLSDVSL